MYVHFQNSAHRTKKHAVLLMFFCRGASFTFFSFSWHLGQSLSLPTLNSFIAYYLCTVLLFFFFKFVFTGLLIQWKHMFVSKILRNKGFLRFHTSFTKPVQLRQSYLLLLLLHSTEIIRARTSNSALFEKQEWSNTRKLHFVLIPCTQKYICKANFPDMNIRKKLYLQTRAWLSTQH